MTWKLPDRNSGGTESRQWASVDLERERYRLSQIIERTTFARPKRESLLSSIGNEWLDKSIAADSRNFGRISTQDLTHLAELYDHHFFDHRCLTLARAYGLRFRWSRRMTSAGGKTTRTRWPTRDGQPAQVRYEIAVSSPLLFQSFQNPGDVAEVCGRTCRDRLEAMQRIVEHELIHLIEMLVWIESDCAARRFQEIANRFFGHTKHRHELITQRERAAKSFNIRLGSRVRFRFEGKVLSGFVNRITRRATVLVEDPSGALFDDGNRYRKYYVPLSILESIEG